MSPPSPKGVWSRRACEDPIDRRLQCETTRTSTKIREAGLISSVGRATSLLALEIDAALDAAREDLSPAIHDIGGSISHLRLPSSCETSMPQTSINDARVSSVRSIFSSATTPRSTAPRPRPEPIPLSYLSSQCCKDIRRTTLIVMSNEAAAVLQLTRSSEYVVTQTTAPIDTRLLVN